MTIEMAENSDSMLPFVREFCTTAAVVSETARLTSQTAHAQVWSAKKVVGPNLTSPTACYGHADMYYPRPIAFIACRCMHMAFD